MDGPMILLSFRSYAECSLHERTMSNRFDANLIFSFFFYFNGKNGKKKREKTSMLVLWHFFFVCFFFCSNKFCIVLRLV